MTNPFEPAKPKSLAQGDASPTLVHDAKAHDAALEQMSAEGAHGFANLLAALSRQEENRSYDDGVMLRSSCDA